MTGTLCGHCSTSGKSRDDARLVSSTCDREHGCLIGVTDEMYGFTCPFRLTMRICCHKSEDKFTFVIAFGYFNDKKWWQIVSQQ